MPIPEAALEQWATQPHSQASKRTHEIIRRALSAPHWQWPQTVKFDTYLQGSYRNDTNIRWDSDVDIVVELVSVFQHNVATLPADIRGQISSTFTPASYHLDSFYLDVLTVLRQTFGEQAVTPGDKAIRVNADTQRLPADVVVCQTYRLYDETARCESGISFETRRERRTIVNFPKQHYENGVSKQELTLSRYKRTVRMFKAARSYLISIGTLDSSVAPSYCIECLLYNMPSSLFATHLGTTYMNAVHWIVTTELDNLKCQNGLQKLFGALPEQWTIEGAYRFAGSLDRLWQSWN